MIMGDVQTGSLLAANDIFRCKNVYAKGADVRSETAKRPVPAIKLRIGWAFCTIRACSPLSEYLADPAVTPGLSQATRASMNRCPDPERPRSRVSFGFARVHSCDRDKRPCVSFVSSDLRCCGLSFTDPGHAPHLRGTDAPRR